MYTAWLTRQNRCNSPVNVWVKKIRAPDILLHLLWSGKNNFALKILFDKFVEQSFENFFRVGDAKDAIHILNMYSLNSFHLISCHFSYFLHQLCPLHLFRLSSTPHIGPLLIFPLISHLIFLFIFFLIFLSYLIWWNDDISCQGDFSPPPVPYFL